MTFLLNEDKALKTLLGGITVSDAKNESRPVGVWFGQPDVEIRQQAYPYLTIELIDIIEANERSMRGIVNIPYTPEGLDPDFKYYSEMPVPVDIDYLVTSYSRQPLHDRKIIASMLSDILPFRFGTLEIPEDGTLRRLELLGYSKRDTTEQGKRLFVNVFSVRVSSELFPSTILGATSPVQEAVVVQNEFYNTNVVPPV